MITKKQKEAVWTLHETEHLSKKAIALQLRISRPKVIEILNDPKNRNLQLIDSVNEINKESNQKLLDMLREDKRIPQIASKILTLFNSDEELEKEIKRSGLRGLATVIGVVSDKVIKASELYLRTENPESFIQPVTIVNDADEVAKIKQERKELMSSETAIN